MRTFYRVNNKHTGQGLWYDLNGEFTGLIHDKFDFCLNTALGMDFDPELVGWLSATENLNDLWFWFPAEDIVRLETHGWFIHEYLVNDDDVKWYERFQHYVIRQTNARLIRVIPVAELS
jgi:hypothetical protein